MVLAHETVTAADAHAAPPQQWMLFLHGILGRRANWRSFARSWAARRPGWGAVLVDLRDHGESQGLSGDRSVAAAGADMVALVEALAIGGGRVAGVLGHSFGAKVAILAAAELRAAGHPLDELWVIDAPPGPRPEPRDQTTTRVFETLAGLPPRFGSRAAFTAALIDAGIAKPIAQWLATNLVGDREGDWRFALELDKLRALLDDFTVADAWPQLIAEARAGTSVRLIVGERSEAVFGDELARARAEVLTGRLRLDTVANAGHWVHVDNPAGLLDLLAG